MPAAYELKKRLGKAHSVTLVNGSEHFQFTPSNPWVMVGWRTPDQVLVPIRPNVERKGIEFVASALVTLDAEHGRIATADGREIGYDHLVLCTGPRLAFEDVEGLGPQAHSHSVCTTSHAALAAKAYQDFLSDPGPIVVGAVQGASCFGPAYECALILDADLRKRKLRHKVPMHFVTSEPYIGHMGLGGVGDSKGMLESELRQRHITWTTNAKVQSVTADAVQVTEHDAEGKPGRELKLPSRFTMLIPAFKGIEPVAAVPELCNPRGFVLIDAHQRNPRYPSIHAAGAGTGILGCGDEHCGPRSGGLVLRRGGSVEAH